MGALHEVRLGLRVGGHVYRYCFLLDMTHSKRTGKFDFFVSKVARNYLILVNLFIDLEIIRASLNYN